MAILPRAVLALLLALTTALLPATAAAAVQVHFYSREFGNQFPHAFVLVEGTLDAGGTKVSGNYGFTAVNVTPGILLGSVKGEVSALKPAYMAKADRKFTVTLDDAGYARLMRKVNEWKALPQPSYSLDKRNCVHFVMELAEVAGLKVNRKSKFFRKPRSFLEEVQKLNPGLK
ncbi:MAG: hypothetical protein SFV20_04410 [Sphingopyxis sp.]|nr:hypothetical protein [Sphingopyxis sp.]